MNEKNDLPWSTKASDYVEAWAIEEYRKASAEALEFTVHKIKLDISSKGRIASYYLGSKCICKVDDWQPDKDANQREMIIKYLQSKGILVTLFYEDEGDHLARIRHIDDELLDHPGKDMDDAFMKAFMEYINQKNKS